MKNISSKRWLTRTSFSAARVKLCLLRGWAVQEAGLRGVTVARARPSARPFALGTTHTPVTPLTVF